MKRQHGGAGLNRTHRRLEDQERLDSFDADGKFFFLNSCRTLPFVREGDLIRIAEYGTEITLSTIHNAAGRVTFFICPSCGRKARFVYLPKFACRECSSLNYETQQVTRGSHRALSIIPEKLGVEKPPENWMDDYDLPKPPRMHEKRFERYRRRFLRHQEQYEEREYKKHTKLFSYGMKAFFEYLDEFGEMFDGSADE